MINDIKSKNQLSELSSSDFTPTKGEPDIRGWIVKNSQNQRLGDVAELIIDEQAGKVRYMVLDANNNDVQLQPQQVLIPIGLAELANTNDVVSLPELSVDQLRALPPYEKGNLSRETELAIQQALTQSNSLGPANNWAATDFYNHSQYQYTNIYNGRKAQTVIGIFNQVPTAQAAVKQLEAANINSDKIELVTRYAAPHSNLVKVDNAPDAYDRFFFSLFSSSADATANMAAARNSNAIVAVYTSTPAETRTASAILQEHNIEANDQSPARATTEVGTGNIQAPAPAISMAKISVPASENANLQLGTIQKNNSEARNHIVDRPVGEPIRRREQRNEHVLGNPTMGEANFTNFRPGIIELIERTEVPVIRKEARVVEEVAIRKILEQHEGTIQDSVRHTEINVQRLNRNDAGLNQ